MPHWQICSSLLNPSDRLHPQAAAADLIFVDYHPFTPLTDGNLPWHIIFGFQQSMVTTTIVAGKVLMKDRKLLTLTKVKLPHAPEKSRLVFEKISRRSRRKFYKIGGTMTEYTPLLLSIAVLGGTGKEGKGLAYRWAKAGYKVIIGSRDASKYEAAAKEVSGIAGRRSACRRAFQP
ncbi:MAG: NAD(P)-binding domain-containing protein [Anaerolineales bacterium]